MMNIKYPTMKYYYDPNSNATNTPMCLIDWKHIRQEIESMTIYKVNVGDIIKTKSYVLQCHSTFADMFKGITVVSLTLLNIKL